MGGICRAVPAEKLRFFQVEPENRVPIPVYKARTFEKYQNKKCVHQKILKKLKMSIFEKFFEIFNILSHLSLCTKKILTLKLSIKLVIKYVFIFGLVLVLPIVNFSKSDSILRPFRLILSFQK